MRRKSTFRMSFLFQLCATPHSIHPNLPFSFRDRSDQFMKPLCVTPSRSDNEPSESSILIVRSSKSRFSLVVRPNERTIECKSWKPAREGIRNTHKNLMSVSPSINFKWQPILIPAIPIPTTNLWCKREEARARQEINLISQREDLDKTQSQTSKLDATYTLWYSGICDLASDMFPRYKKERECVWGRRRKQSQREVLFKSYTLVRIRGWPSVLVSPSLGLSVSHENCEQKEHLLYFNT